jgi:hypothetical protein
MGVGPIPFSAERSSGGTPEMKLESKKDVTGVASQDLFGGWGRTANPKDVVMTPADVARMIVNHFQPAGRILDPCRGNGAFWNAMPGAEWCEIAEGKDFMEWKTPVDWIVSNPPYSTFWDFLEHSFKLAENIVYLIPLHKIWSGHRYMKAITQWGGLRETLIIGTGTSIGFPVGLSVGAVHFQRGYAGPMVIGYPPNA